MELAQDAGYMVFDGSLSEDELLRNLAITCTFREEFKNLDLPWTQRLLLWRAGGPGSGTTFSPKFHKKLVGNPGLDGGFTCIHLTNSCHQFISGDIFEE